MRERADGWGRSKLHQSTSESTEILVQANCSAGAKKKTFKNFEKSDLVPGSQLRPALAPSFGIPCPYGFCIQFRLVSELPDSGHHHFSARVMMTHESRLMTHSKIELTRRRCSLLWLVSQGSAGHHAPAAATVGPSSAHSTRRQAFMPTPVAALLDCVRNILHGSSALRALIHASIVHRTGSA